MTIDGVSVFSSRALPSKWARFLQSCDRLASVTTDPTTCTATPLLQANVTFNDYPTGVYSLVGPTVVACCSGMTQTLGGGARRPIGANRHGLPFGTRGRSDQRWPCLRNSVLGDRIRRWNHGSTWCSSHNSRQVSIRCLAPLQWRL